MSYKTSFRLRLVGLGLCSLMAAVPNALAHANPLSCPTAKELKTQALYGRWKVQWSPGPGGLDMPLEATLVLERHEEFSESLAGVISRTLTATQVKTWGLTPQAALAGDLEEGLLLLDESSDNVHITATWNAEMTPGSCGRVFHGLWTDMRPNPSTEKAAEKALSESREKETESKAAEPPALTVPFILTRLN